jgi:hypothetical protein
VHSFFKVIIATVLVSLSHLPPASSSDVYKYRDEQGKWVFTDKKPTAAAATETLRYENDTKEKIEPKIYITANNHIEVINPFYVPIERKI